MKNIFRKLKINLLKIYHARGSAHEIALGAAIGSFWGVFPTFGLSTVFSLLLYRILRFNIVVAISASFISNPLTSPFWLVFSYNIGLFFTDAKDSFKFEKWYENLGELGFTMLIGSLLLSSITALVVFFLTRFFVKRKQERKYKTMGT
jgi:uncharacterized protein (DUF2062 family)